LPVGRIPLNTVSILFIYVLTIYYLLFTIYY